jgi:hypothetical protein
MLSGDYLHPCEINSLAAAAQNHLDEFDKAPTKHHPYPTALRPWSNPALKATNPEAELVTLFSRTQSVRRRRASCEIWFRRDRRNRARPRACVTLKGK